MSTKRYDAVIVGAGAGGGVVAGVLAEAGKRVLLIERGQAVPFTPDRDHLRNQRLSQYGNNAGPEDDGERRIFIDLQGHEHEARPFEGGYHNNAACVGGGTRVYGGMAWRFLPQDFRMASLYGVPPGSSLADWPIGYADLAPYYDRAEWEIGVAGEAATGAALWPGRPPYPLPPVPLTPGGAALRDGAASLGWPTITPPVLLNTVPRAGRSACIGCQHCVGFPCPTDAKNGTHNTLIPRALATGRCEMVTGAMVERLTTDGAGRVSGVAYIDSGGQRREAAAEIVVVSAGAIETARLLLNSASPAHPKGIGNRSDQVGRHLQGHVYAGATGLMPTPVASPHGPGLSTATCRFNHANDGIVGGGLLADDFTILPIIYWKRKLPPDIPRWGAANKAYMRDAYPRTLDVTGPTQDIPSPESRVTVDPLRRDRWGLPVARLSGATHPQTIRTAHFMADRAAEWLTAAGAVKVWQNKPGLGLSAGQHQAGTCRMGEDPRRSVVDPHGRVHGHDNLFIADGSVHVTNGGFNPVLTIYALAFRTADYIARNW